jgi:sarcosine oxidase subunit beta
MSRPKVVVIGAGVLGLSTAIEIAGDGVADVTVVDRAHPGAGSTGLSAGVFTSQYLTEDDVEIRAWSMRRLAHWHEELGLLLRRVGLLRLSRDAATTEVYRRSVELQQAHGLAGARVIGSDEVAVLLPRFQADGVEAALYSPHDGYLDGSELCTLLAAHGQSLGVRLVTRAAVTGLRRGGGDARYVLTTEAGDVAADMVCNCAGAWGAQVGAALEAPVSVVNERHEAYIFEKPPELETIYPMVLDNVPGQDKEEGLYFRAEGETQLVAGLHSNGILGHPVTDPDSCYAGVTPDAADAVITRFAAAFPSVDGMRYRGGWAGLYPHSPDQRPVAGPHPDNPDVLVGSGLGGVGLSLGPVLGRLLADWVAYGEPRCVDAGARLVPRPAVVAAAPMA